MTFGSDKPDEILFSRHIAGDVPKAEFFCYGMESRHGSLKRPCVG
jgi:hypothetical protein